MSKPLLATAAVLLARDARPPFALDHKVRKYLPELPASWRNITINHLLSHLSGIKEYLDIREFSTRQEYSDADLLNLAIRYPLNFTPGEQFDYTNTGYCVLAMVIERTTKKPYGDILRERIFAPLGMRSTRVNDSTAIIPGRAAGYAFRFGRRLHADFVARTQLALGDCGVVSTINDLVLWDKEMWNCESKILPKDMLKQMWTPARLNNGKFTKYGLGWDLVVGGGGKVCAVHHGGEIEGFRSIILRYLCDRLSVIVLFNGELERWKNGEFAVGVADLVVGRKPGRSLAPGFEAGSRRAGRIRH
jgi:CubicO group peptidase (beta-lactamase class C family)